MRGLCFRKLFSPPFLKRVLLLFYLFALPLYIFYGLQPAEATEPQHYLNIPDIKLDTPVTRVYLENNKIPTPDYLPGLFERPQLKFLIGHSSLIFQDLKQLSLHQKLFLDQKTYQIRKIVTQHQSTIDMSELLKTPKTPQLILMTCAGEPLGNHNYTHRLLIFADEILE